jgi:hypothetical protein
MEPYLKWVSQKKWSWVGLSLCLVLALFRVLTSSAAPPLQPLSPETATQIADQLASQEPAMRLRNRQRFPGDRWSQDDDFHASEAGWARQQAGLYRTSLQEIFKAVDAHLKKFSSCPAQKNQRQSG